MNYSKNFRDFDHKDCLGYQGAVRLPGGEIPKIYSIEREDFWADIIISGNVDNGEGSLIEVVTEDNNYVLVFEEYDRCQVAIADSLANSLETEDGPIETILFSYGMKKVF